MSKFDTQDWLEIKGAAREYDVPAVTLNLAIKNGTLRVIELDGKQKIFRADLEQFIKRTVKRGAGNIVTSRVINPIEAPKAEQ